MRTSILIAVLSGLCWSSCTGPSPGSTGVVSSNAGAGTSNSGAQILSQDDCDRQAGLGITASNCDAEFDKLVREIEADQADGG